MKNFSRCVFLASLTISSTACGSYLQQHQTEYLRAQTSQPIRVPAGLSNSNIREDYPVPGVSAASTKGSVNIAPPNSLSEQVAQGKLSSKALKQREAMLERADNINENNDASSDTYSGFKNNTLMLNQPVSAAWPVVEDAITKAGYKTVVKNEHTHIFYILDVYSSNGKITRETPIYQVHLSTTPLGTEVSVTDNRGRRADLNDSNRILDSIYNMLPKKSARKPVDNSVVTQPNGAVPNANPTSNFGRLMNSLFH